MAGRGTDIMLGGNAEYLAKSALRHDELSEEMIIEATGFAETEDADIIAARQKYKEYYDKFKAEIAPEAEAVRNAGGLCIIGTERHDSRRIDNQLRGRAGRQGDPGDTKFYISLEDDLMRLYGGERISALMDTLNVEEDVPLESGMLSKTIESAQRKKEGMNFAARKSVLQYDDVMNKQRELIYTQRNQVLDGKDIKDSVLKMIDETIDSYTQIYLADDVVHDEWDVNGLREYFLGWITDSSDLRFTIDELGEISRAEVAELLKEKAHNKYEQREAEFGSQVMREIERVMLLRSVDTNWMDHIDNMDRLRQGIGLRAYGQHDPVIEYRNESYDMFSAMTDSIREQTSKLVLTVQVRRNEEVKREKVAKETETGAPLTVKGKGAVSKNALCPCGSGKKYKRCCGKDIED
jgi:preprotein translocase subunit SecA